jgi:hypothetical protein
MTNVAGYKRITTGYTPRPLQAELHANLKRFNVLVMHRRFGKTVFAINEMIDRALRNQLKRPQYAYLAPTYGQAKRIAWEYLKEYTKNIPGADPNEADLRVDIPRPQSDDHIRLMLLGAENPMALKGLYLDGVIPDEYAEMKPTVWSEVIRPTLSDRLGWAIFLGTPKGRNDFYKKYDYAKSAGDPEWYAAMFKASETGILPQSELDSAKKSMTDDEYEQEYECSFNAGLVGSYFAKDLAKAEKEKRITRVPHDPMIPVDTYWDLGLNDVNSIWFIQSFRRRHRIVDYLETCGIGVPDIVAQVRNKGYNLGRWVFPHDVQVKDFSTGKARIQAFESLGCKPYDIVPRVGAKTESINAARMIFGACEFDAENCKLGLEALAEYQREWSEKNGTFKNSPLHNWASNGADAFQTFALGAGDDSRNSLGGDYYSEDRPMIAETSYNPFNWRAQG